MRILQAINPVAESLFDDRADTDYNFQEILDRLRDAIP